MIESTMSDLVERYLTPEKAFGGEGKSWLVTFLKVHKEGGGKQVRVRGVDGAGRPINHLYTMHERKLKGHKYGSTYADCVKLCRKFARDCVDNLTNRLDELGKLGPTKLFRAGKWPKIKAQREKKCKEWLNGCSKLFRNKLPGFDIKAAERELPTFCAIMEAHHEMESFTQGLSNFLGSADSKSEGEVEGEQQRMVSEGRCDGSSGGPETGREGSVHGASGMVGWGEGELVCRANLISATNPSSSKPRCSSSAANCRQNAARAARPLASDVALPYA
ncbi:unnamed protein product [Closterium sp. NIES-64]|nr:unnamed protein product [Closterium sp. NIES-64]